MDGLLQQKRTSDFIWGCRNQHGSMNPTCVVSTAQAAGTGGVSGCRILQYSILWNIRLNLLVVEHSSPLEANYASLVAFHCFTTVTLLLARIRSIEQYIMLRIMQQDNGGLITVQNLVFVYMSIIFPMHLICCVYCMPKSVLWLFWICMDWMLNANMSLLCTMLIFSR